MRRHFDRDTVQVIEKISDTGIVIRIVKIWFDYNRDSLIPKESIYENARVFVRYDPDGKITIEPYYYSYSKGTLTHWMPGERPVFSCYQYNYEANASGHVYCRRPWRGRLGNTARWNRSAASVRIKAEADARMRREFQAAMEAVSGHLDFEADGMKIVLPDGPGCGNPDRPF